MPSILRAALFHFITGRKLPVPAAPFALCEEASVEAVGRWGKSGGNRSCMPKKPL